MEALSIFGTAVPRIDEKGDVESALLKGAACNVASDNVSCSARDVAMSRIRLGCWLAIDGAVPVVEGMAAACLPGADRLAKRVVLSTLLRRSIRTSVSIAGCHTLPIAMARNSTL